MPAVMIALGLLPGLRSLSAQTADAPLRLVEDAVAALGGRDRLLAVRTLIIEGYGSNPNIGQAMTPEADPLLWMLPDYRRSIDLEHGTAILQPIDLRIMRHDRREPTEVRADTSCVVEQGRLDCAVTVRGPDYRAWIVPESIARQAGPGALEAALAAPAPAG